MIAKNIVCLLKERQADTAIVLVKFVCFFEIINRFAEQRIHIFALIFCEVATATVLTSSLKNRAFYKRLNDNIL